MWIRVATNKDSLLTGKYGDKYVDGEHSDEFYFDKNIAKKLEEDGFLTEMWDKFDALFDWGDCDFFGPEKCEKLQGWLKDRLGRNLTPEVRRVYEVLLDYAEKAEKYDTGIDFDF